MTDPVGTDEKQIVLTGKKAKDAAKCMEKEGVVEPGTSAKVAVVDSDRKYRFVELYGKKGLTDPVAFMSEKRFVDHPNGVVVNSDTSGFTKGKLEKAQGCVAKQINKAFTPLGTIR